MNGFDARARRASAAIHESLATAPQPATFATVVRRAAIAKVMNLALVGAGAALFIAAGAAFRTPPPPAPVADAVTTTTTTEAPSSTTVAPEQPTTTILALPTATEPPTTTTTTTVPPTTTTKPPSPTTTKPPSTTTTKPPDTTPPTIKITSPENRTRVTEPVVMLRGITEPGAKVYMGELIATVGEAGRWKLIVELEPGPNRLVVTAKDAAGNKAHAEVVVIYDNPEPAPFVAHAKFGSCDLDPPYDVYYGSGEPGSTVFVNSKYGEGSTTVGPEGGWEIKVFFPEAPPEVPFLVEVGDEFGRSKTFEFVSYAGKV